jgi:hypothetical protein
MTQSTGGVGYGQIMLPIGWNYQRGQNKMTKSLLYYLITFNLGLNLLLLVMDWQEIGLSGGRFSAVMGWMVAWILEVRNE